MTALLQIRLKKLNNMVTITLLCDNTCEPRDRCSKNQLLSALYDDPGFLCGTFYFCRCSPYLTLLWVSL
jgi:hypothetical protein